MDGFSHEKIETVIPLESGVRTGLGMVLIALLIGRLGCHRRRKPEERHQQSAQAIWSDRRTGQ